MKCIIGLGNPESKYLNTKHNFGFWVIDKLVKQRSLKYKLGKGDFIYASDNQLMFIKPTLFINNSGIVIKQLLNYYDDFNIDDLIIIYDDIDINLGNIRFRKDGADGDHKGIKSIIYHLQKMMKLILNTRQQKNLKKIINLKVIIKIIHLVFSNK